MATKKENTEAVEVTETVVEEPAKKTVKRASKKKPTTLTIKLVRSLSGRIPSHVSTVKSLGLKKIGDVTVQPDNEATRGKLAKVGYMVEVQ